MWMKSVNVYCFFILTVPINYFTDLVNDDIIWILEVVHDCQGILLCIMAAIWIKIMVTYQYHNLIQVTNYRQLIFIAN